VAQTCRKALRVVDIVGRWGGEEFCVVLPETSCEGAVLTGERIRSMVEALEIELAPGISVRRTVSIGVAQLEPGMTRLEDLVNRADSAMYRAKDTGRNRVVVF
jgi:diguanylate cyclase (GGDEF)-like protein